MLLQCCMKPQARQGMSKAAGNKQLSCKVGKACWDILLQTAKRQANWQVSCDPKGNKLGAMFYTKTLDLPTNTDWVKAWQNK